MKTEYSINYDADTIEEAKEYLAYRYKQLKKFGLSVVEEKVIEGVGIHTKYTSFSKTLPEDVYHSLFVLKPNRGQNKFNEYFGTPGSDKRIVSLEECEMEEYLKHSGHHYVILKHSTAYQLIKHHYSDERAKRSGVPLIYHIDEGGAILEYISASEIVKNAYYLHPLLQSDEDFNEHKSLSFYALNISTESIILAMEYRRVANSFLSTDTVKDFVGFSCEEVKQMLIADKIQNYKDFMVYHHGKHERSEELHDYFNEWFELLDIDKDLLVELYELIM